MWVLNKCYLLIIQNLEEILCQSWQKVQLSLKMKDKTLQAQMLVMLYTYIFILAYKLLQLDSIIMYFLNL